MKRLARTIVVFLLLGAIVNVGVAWGLLATIQAWYVPDTDGLWKGWVWKDQDFIRFASHVLRPGGGHTELHMTPEVVPGRFERVLALYADKVVTGVSPDMPRWSAAMQQDLPRLRDRELFVVDEARGWPCLTLSSRLMFRYPFGMIASSSITVHGGLRLKDDGRRMGSGLPQARALPVQPLLPGFVVNSVFYAAILWLLFAAPFALRRRRRIKRGLCPACAYPVGASPVCTECGAELNL
jgi:hypothetical protein